MSEVVAFWQSHASEAGALLAQHVALVAASTLVAVAAGVPLGILSARNPRIGAPLAAVANIVQTVPSLALFGFLLPLPLVGGIGARTAVTALILYALLPVIRTTSAGSFRKWSITMIFGSSSWSMWLPISSVTRPTTEGSCAWTRSITASRTGRGRSRQSRGCSLRMTSSTSSGISGRKTVTMCSAIRSGSSCW